MSEERTDNVKDLHLLACLVWPRDRGIVFRASSPSIAARIHSRAMFTKLGTVGLSCRPHSPGQTLRTPIPTTWCTSIKVPFVALNNASIPPSSIVDALCPKAGDRRRSFPAAHPQFQEPDIWSGVTEADRRKKGVGLAAITLAAAIGFNVLALAIQDREH